jgi:hypothetical protein
MRRAVLVCAVVATVLAAMPVPAWAQRLNLSVSPQVISFPSSDPDAVAIINAPAMTVTYRVRQNGGSPWLMTVLAGGDLNAGTAHITISNVTWTATPAPPFQNGTLSRTVAQRIASGTGNVNPARTGSVTFRLANSWTYSTGNYTQTVLFTLSAP